MEYKAEMVASVYKILTEVGAEVAIGDSLLILESMKMEIPVVAEAPGRVHEVCVVEGDVVGEGDALVVVA